MELLTDKVIYHVETQEDYDDLMERLEKLGYKWWYGAVCTSINYFPEYGVNTAIRVEDKKINFSPLSYYLDNLNSKYKDHQIIKYKKEQNMKVKLKASEKFIADWYENHKDDLDYYIFEEHVDLSDLNEVDIANDKFFSWLNDGENKPVQTLVKMHLFGYEIEQEKLYTVEIPNPNIIGNEFLVLMRNGFKQIVALTKYGEEWRNQKAFQLTENEIKKDFAWAWNFAREV